MTINLVDYIHESDAKESGASLCSQYQLGDFVEVGVDSMQEMGEAVIKGWVVGVTFTASRVYYDVAVDTGLGLCAIHKRLRCFMRRESDGKETNFIKFEEVQEMLKSEALDDECQLRVATPNNKVLH